MPSYPIKINKRKAKTQYWQERIELAAAFRWTARLNMHEAVGNHLSLSVSEDGTKFLINPNLMHFSLIRASDLILLDSEDPETMKHPYAPDPSAWGLHGSIHKLCPHHRCIMHVHPTYATVLASLSDSNLPAIDQNSAAFFNRIIIDENYGGLALEDEAKRCAMLLSVDTSKKVMIMGNHGVMIMGDSVKETFNRMYFFERAAKTYVKALQTGKPLRFITDKIAAKVANETENYNDFAERHLENLMTILDKEGSDYAS